MASQKQNILYLLRDGFDYYGSEMTGGIHFSFPENLVKDLDVLNITELKEKILAYIGQNQIASGNYIIALSEHVYFEKDFSSVAKDQQDATVQQYVETVPFENSLSKIFPIENGFKVIVVNRDLCFALQQAFAEKGFVIEGITPVLVLGTTLTGGENGLSADSIRFLFEKYAILKQNSFPIQVASTEKSVAVEKPQVEGVTQRVNKRLILLILTFVILMAILIFVVATNTSTF